MHFLSYSWLLLGNGYDDPISFWPQHEGSLLITEADPSSRRRGLWDIVQNLQGTLCWGLWERCLKNYRI